MSGFGRWGRRPRLVTSAAEAVFRVNRSCTPEQDSEKLFEALVSPAEAGSAQQNIDGLSARLKPCPDTNPDTKRVPAEFLSSL